MEEGIKRQFWPAREPLADYAHMAWAGWMRYFLGKCEVNSEGLLCVPAEYLKNLQKQIGTPYERLSPTDQAADLAEADKILDTFLAAMRRGGAQEGG